ncbi:Rib/alpha-like domain-containing protein, partial [Granulicatella elegans]
MFFYNKNQQVNEKRQKFSIRKYKVGTFSVVVGALFYLNGISNIVQATEISENSVPATVEEKQSGESKKAEEPQQPKVQEGVNTTATQPKVTEKTEIETKKETSKAEVKQGDVAVDSMTEHPVAASKVETKPVLENKETQKESAENEAFIQELNQVLLEGKSLESNVHIAFRLEVEQLAKEMEEAIKNSKSITKDIIEQYKEKIQNLKKKNDEYQNGLNEKVNKIKALQEEINSISSSIQYTLEPQETALLKVAGEFSVSRQTVEEADGLITSLKQLRNKVANRMTRAHSGKRDPRNGQPIAGKDESGFRAVYFLPTQNQHGRGEAGLVNETRTDLTYYNSDEIYSFMRVLGQRGPGEPLYKYEYGENRGKEDKSPYYLKTVGVISGLDKLKGITLRVAYKNPRTGKEDFQDITSGVWPVNNPEVKAVIRGWLGRYDKTGEAVEPGDYRVTIAAGRKNPENSITYTFHVKAQSERNTVNDLATPTYVDDVRHLTEAEKTALIKKFEAAHPGVVNRPVHVDYDHAEVSADGATMTIHFKDGFAPKTIQTNAQNDAVAKHQNITALYGDPHDFYKNPRNLVKSKTGNELPSTVDVTWKTPFNLQQPGTRNAVVTVTYQNGTVKDVSTPYTVLDFIGKQDKRIYQNQSGELGDARSYITLSNGTTPATDLTIRWKGGSTVDTSRPTVHHKQIEILRGNTTMKTVDIPVQVVDNIRPTVEIPYDNPGNQEVYVYSHENNNITLKAKDNNGKVSKVYLAFPADNRQGLGQEDSSYLGGGSPDGLYLTATKIKSETTGSDVQPATITVSGNINNQPFTGEKSITRYLYTEDPAGNANYEHVGHANDNGAPGRVRFVWKPQTFKYTATANSQTQAVSYKEEPSAEASINKTGLPSGTTYTWKTKPDTSSPGNKSGVVEVTYPDTSKDTVNVTVSVRKLSDEYAPTGNKIVRNQNAAITNDDLKAAVNISNNGKIKVKSVTPVGTISTANAGTQTIKATVTYLDDTTDPVDIPLEVKDVTAPTITTPIDRQNWDLIALDRTSPSIKVAATDNAGGTGVKSTTVTGLPDFLVYDNTTKTIKFKNGVQEVTKLPVGQDSKTYTATIQVTDNADNPSQRQFTITVKSMTTKYNATPNVQKQTVSYGATPDAGTSINKNDLPTGTTYTWATTPSTTAGPGDKAGSVTVTYPDGSKDTVNVTVNVRALNDEYNLAATEIEVNQNDQVSNDKLKTVVSATSKVGKVNGTDKISTVTAPTVNTANYGSQNITATVTFKDGTVKEVTIPLKVKDVTDPTIQSPAEKTNWEMTALDKTLPNMEVRAEDNANGSGIATIEVNNIPPFLTFDQTSGTIVFKEGVQEVPRIDSDNVSYGVTIVARDKAGNSTSKLVNITVSSMRGKYTPTGIPQEVDNGHVPDPETSVNKTGLPEGTTVTWKTRPDVSTPGSHPGVALVHYPDGTEDEVEVPVTVKEQKDTFNPTAKEPNQTVRHNEVPDPEKSINTNDLPAGTKYSWSEQPDTSKPGSKTGKVLITYPDKSTEEVTVTVNVTPQKDEYNPT